MKRPTPVWGRTRIRTISDAVLRKNYDQQLRALSDMINGSDKIKHRITLRVVNMREELKRRGLIRHYGNSET